MPSLDIQEYTVRRLVNVSKHVDGPWFWNRYSAKPYVGCRSGCEFCFLRGHTYLRNRSPDTFDTLIQVKVNAVERLAIELQRLEPDVLQCGDWQQPVESRYRISRRMLAAAGDARFPVLVVERSPLLERDIDVLLHVQQQSWAGVIICLSNVDPALKHAFEPRSPGIRRRLRLMAKLAKAGIPVGTSLMPIIPFVGDDVGHLDAAVAATADHGGSFVLAGGMSMDGAQADRTLVAAGAFEASLPLRIRSLYGQQPDGTLRHSPPREYAAQIGSRVRELCERRRLSWRMPRYVPNAPLGVNKWLAERLFVQCYELELQLANPYRIWAYRKAAWTVDEHPVPLDDLSERGGVAALRALPNLGVELSRLIMEDLKLWKAAREKAHGGEMR